MPETPRRERDDDDNQNNGSPAKVRHTRSKKNFFLKKSTCIFYPTENQNGSLP